MVHGTQIQCNRLAVATGPRKTFGQRMPVQSYTFYMRWSVFLLWLVDFYADKMRASFQIVCPLAFALCLLAMMWCQYVEIVMACNGPKLWPSLGDNVSGIQIDEKKKQDGVNIWVWICVFRIHSPSVGHTYRIFVPIAHPRIDKILQQPVNRFIIEEHLEECYQIW